MRALYLDTALRCSSCNPSPHHMSFLPSLHSQVPSFLLLSHHHHHQQSLRVSSRSKSLSHHVLSFQSHSAANARVAYSFEAYLEDSCFLPYTLPMSLTHSHSLTHTHTLSLSRARCATLASPSLSPRQHGADTYRYLVSKVLGMID